MPSLRSCDAYSAFHVVPNMEYTINILFFMLWINEAVVPHMLNEAHLNLRRLLYQALSVVLLAFMKNSKEMKTREDVMRAGCLPAC